MKANEAYFQRLRGNWSFDPYFTVSSWIGLYHSPATFFNKVRLASFVLSQHLLGRYRMNTVVAVDLSKHQVKHSTVVKKFGISILRSEKTFSLHPNGYDLELRGAEYYWPFTNLPVEFKPMRGCVHSSSTRAEYEMPLVGLTTRCESVMESPQAFIRIQLPWFEGVFNFTTESMKELHFRDQA